MSILKDISEKLQKGDPAGVQDYVEQAIAGQLDAKTILDDGLIAGMTVVGDKFKAHEIFLPDVLLAAKAMYAGLDLLKPLLVRDGIPMIGKVVIGTVQGDLHDIGKNLVGIMLKGAGFEVIDLGRDVAPEKFLDTAREMNAGVIGLSALLTTTMPVMKKVVDLAIERGMREELKIVIGGASVSEEYAREIGADAYCYDGVNAVDRVKEFLGVK